MSALFSSLRAGHAASSASPVSSAGLCATNLTMSSTMIVSLPKPMVWQPAEQRARLDRVVGVAFVKVVQAVAGQAVGADQHAARPEHPERLGQDLVLPGQRRNVVQHRERADRVERPVRIAQRRRVTDYHLDVAAGVLARQPGGRLGVDLDHGQPLHLVPQPLGGRAGAGADLEHVGTEAGLRGQGRQDLGLDMFRPLGARAQSRVVLVHDPDATDTGRRTQERRLPSRVAGWTT